MHTPDGFLTGWICVITLLITIGMIIFSVINAKKWMTKQKAFLMSGLAAIIFAFQMLNFSIGNGTSGHLIGGAVVAILLCPEAAVLVLSVVLLVQTFIFGDGGVFALGANIFLMGVVAGYSAHYSYQLLKKRMPALSRMLAGWVSVVSASFIAAILLGVSGTVSFQKVIPAMVLTHFFIGIGEAIITGVILFYFDKIKDIFLKRCNEKIMFGYIALSVICALVVISFGLPFASQSPDGLEKVALNLGFFEKATELYILSPIPDYSLSGEDSYFFALLSSVIGMVLCFIAGFAITRPIVLKY